MEKQKILIVDDSEMNRDLLIDILEDQYDIVEAENGAEAVAILLQERTDFSLLLLDIMMPQMDGFEVLTCINKNHWNDTFAVIMISADDSPANIKRAYDLGAFDYISRPFDSTIVQRRISNTMFLYARQQRLEEIIAEQFYEQEKNNKLMIAILSHIVEFRNGESGLHILHVNTITKYLLKQLVQRTDKYPLSKSDITLISTASSLHDIGKISISDTILNKPGRLTAEEFEVMKTHSAIGGKILMELPMEQQKAPLVKVAFEICRWHHERYDGNGYPDGLKGEEIPIAAQVVALADVYDALISKRCYKNAYSHDEALKMILDGQCGAFNPVLLLCLQEISDTLKHELTFASSEKETNDIQNMRSIRQKSQRTKRQYVFLTKKQMTSKKRGNISMDLRDCYNSFGGDFDEALGRLRREQTVRKFVYKFLDDKSFDLFEAAMRDRDYGEAIRAVHTLKGICQNLSFGRLYASSSLMTKALKENDYNKAVDMMPQLSNDYCQIINKVKEYKRSREE